ncbi:MAG TPA: S41 family peptidase [Gemmataceae bacterium]
MKRWFCLGLVIALFPGLLSEARPQEKVAPTPRAVIVGVGEFADEQIRARPSAEADAAAIYELLTDPAHLGIEKKNARLLTSGGGEGDAQKGTRENILKALREAVAAAGPDDPLFVFLIGQGASAGERTCYFTADTVFKDRAKTAVLASDIEEIFKGLKSRRLFAAIDIHFKGFDPGKEVILEPNVLDMVRGFLGHDEADENFQPSGRAVILGNSGNASAVSEGHGVFTTVMLEALKGGADKEGYEPDGLVTVDELIEAVESDVPPRARRAGKTREEKEQLPFVEFARASHFVLTHNPKAYPGVRAALKKLDALDLPKDVAEQGRQMLSRMPKLKAHQELRKAYQRLVAGALAKDAFLAEREKILAAMELDEADARTYARKVYAGVESVARVFIREVNKGEMVADAVRGLFQRLEADLPKEIEARLAKAKELSKDELLELMADAREHLGKREDLAENKDVDISLRAMMLKLDDPYTSYIDREQVKRIESQLKGQFTGIGIQIRRDLVRDGLLVVTPIKDSPAYKAGLKAGDLITSIIREVDSEGQKLPEPEVISTRGMKVDEAVKKILGKEGTKVKVEVQREGATDPITFELTRARVEVESVLGWQRKPDDTWDFWVDPQSKIGYIHLTQFARSSYEDMRKAVEAMVKDGLKGLVIDLRFNPGGYLDTAVDICDMFIDDGLIVSIKPRVGLERPFTGQQEGSLLDFPMVVLINGASASGSEILAACLQDHGRAVVMGERSYGKGSVQNIQGFGPTGAEIKLTTATFWRPSGKNLNKASTKGGEEEDWGVRPNKGFELKLSRMERDLLSDRMRDREIIPRRDLPKKEKEKEKEFTDKQLQTALDYLREQIKMTVKRPAAK